MGWHGMVWHVPVIAAGLVCFIATIVRVFPGIIWHVLLDAALVGLRILVVSLPLCSAAAAIALAVIWGRRKPQAVVDWLREKDLHRKQE